MCRVSSFGQGSIDNGCGNACAAAADDRYIGLYALGFEDGLELGSGEESLVIGVEEVSDWYGDGERNVAGG